MLRFTHAPDPEVPPHGRNMYQSLSVQYLFLHGTKCSCTVPDISVLYFVFTSVQRSTFTKSLCTGKTQSNGVLKVQKRQKAMSVHRSCSCLSGVPGRGPFLRTYLHSIPSQNLRELSEPGPENRLFEGGSSRTEGIREEGR